MGGLLTLISSVPNIIVGQAAGIGFVPFFLTSAPFVFVATLVTLFQARLTFGVKSLATDEERKIAAELVASFDEKESVPSVRFFWCSVLLLLGFIVCLAGQSALPWDLDELGMGLSRFSLRAWRCGFIKMKLTRSIRPLIGICSAFLRLSLLSSTSWSRQRC